MAAPRTYSEELREQGTRMALEAIAAEGKQMVVIRRIAGQLETHPERCGPGLSGRRVMLARVLRRRRGRGVDRTMGVNCVGPTRDLVPQQLFSPQRSQAARLRSRQRRFLKA